MASSNASITDEALSRARLRLGIPEKSRRMPFNEYATLDTIRHYAYGFGDDNPLWSDPAYAASSPWSEVIAPPMYPISAGVPEPVTWTREQGDAMSGGDPLKGIGQYLRAERWHFAGPITVGTRLTRRRALVKAERTEPSSFAGGQSGAVMCWRMVYSDERDPEHPVAVNEREFFYTERDTAPTAKRRDAVAHYDVDALQAIDDLYEAETRRGMLTRTKSNVSVGDQLGSIVRGPLTITDVMAHHVGTGLGGAYGVGPLRLGYLNRRHVPGFYSMNEQGVPDVVQRCHWENAWAQELGHPSAYDYGMMRMTWLSHLVTDWMGDGATMLSFEGSARKFNYIGDTQWMSGTVENIVDTASGTVVHLVLEGKNQADEVTCRATVTVLLPSSVDSAAKAPPLEESLFSFDRDALGIFEEER
jgi:acyl dehydratase